MGSSEKSGRQSQRSRTARPARLLHGARNLLGPAELFPDNQKGATLPIRFRLLGETHHYPSAEVAAVQKVPKRFREITPVSPVVFH